MVLVSMPMSIAWPLPPAHTALENDDVHVWCVWLNQSEDVVRCLFETLSPDERDRATKFYFQRHRHSFIVARGMLRKILGTYLYVEPDQLRFSYGSYGKPSLAEAQRGDGIHFNVSRSHGLGLYAFTRRRDIGVDVEWRRQDFDLEEVARQFFSQQEIATLGSLPSSQRKEGFFNCWTRKEAYIKALGEGLSLPLNQFDVSLTPGVPAALLNTRGDAQGRGRWSLRELQLGPLYSAAVAVEGEIRTLNCWRWAVS